MNVMKYLRAAIIVVLVLSLCSLGSVSQTSAQVQVIGPPLIPQPGKPGGSLTFALPSAPPTLNPLFSINPITELTLSPLIRINRIARKIEPALAASYTLSPDGKSVTFHLRQGLEWSDGAPFTADDVVFSFGLYLNPNLQTILGLPAQIKQQFRIEKLDESTVKISAPGPIPLDQLALIEILPQHLLGSVPINRLKQTWTLDTPLDKLAGLGPFHISQIVRTGFIFKTTEKIVLAKNPHFWQVDQQGQSLPYLDQLTIRFVKDGNQALELFKKGETDLQVLTYIVSLTKAMAQLQSAGFPVLRTAPALPFMLIFNQDDPKLGAVFRDPRFRQAVNLAINRAQLAAQLSGGLAFPDFSFIRRLSLFYDPDHLIPDVNLAQAKVLLDQMGLKTGSNGIREFNGQPLRFELFTVQGSKTFAAVGQYLEQALKQVGLAVELKPIPNREYGAAFSRPAHFQAAMFHPGESYDPSPSFNIFYSQSDEHFYRFSDIDKKPAELSATQRKLDTLIQQLNGLFLTLEGKKQIISQIEQILVEDLPIIPLARDPFLVAVRKDLHNVQNLVPDDITWDTPLPEALAYVWRETP